MLQKGSMVPVKKGLGILLLASGAGILFMPDKTILFLINMKILFGIILLAAGYLSVIAGRQR